MSAATPQDTFDHLLGSGAFTFDWWHRHDDVHGVEWAGDVTSDWSLTLTCDDGDDGGVKSATISHQVIMATARSVVENPPAYASKSLVRECQNLLDNPDEADFDAPMADELLQLIVLGEITFG